MRSVGLEMTRTMFAQIRNQIFANPNQEKPMVQNIRMMVLCSLFFGIGAVSLQAGEVVRLANDHIELTLSETGRVEQFLDRTSNIDYLDSNADRSFCLLRPQKTGSTLSPNQMTRDGDSLVFSFPETPIRVTLKIFADQISLTFELVKVEGGEFYALQFARVPLSIDITESDFAATAMSRKLNTTTLDLPGRSRILGGHCFQGLGIDGAGVILLGMPEKQLRKAMKSVVDSYPPGEMPVSKAGGPYALDNPKNQGAYIITSEPLTVENVDSWCEHLAKFGVNQVDFHHGRPFRQGDFHFNEKAYPNGIADFRKTSDALRKRGMIAGLHTYAEFLDPNCRFVSPVPHKDLDVMGRFSLAADLSADDKTVPVDESTAGVSEITGFFVRNSKVVRIGDELILFGKPNKEAPFGFSECTRGAYGTKISEHKKGEPVEHLTQFFHLFVPRPDSELFLEIARETARAYNEGGFEMIYLDALDGTWSIVEDKEHTWYYDALFVNEILKHTKTPPLLEYSTMNPSLWYARSRMGAWDSPHRGYERFIDLHAASNVANAERAYLPGQFGWLALCPTNGDNLKNYQYNIFFPEDVEYLGTKALAYGNGFSYLDIQKGDLKPAAFRNGAVLKNYDTLRRSGYFSSPIRERLKEKEKHFLLRQSKADDWFFLEANYGKAVLGDDRNTFEYVNPFAAQKPMIRIENRYLTSDYDADGAVELIPLDETEPGRALTSREFLEPLDLSKHLGLGLWVFGDGGRQQINVRLDSPPHLIPGHTDHLIDVDFEGWRYFSLVEADNGIGPAIAWPVPCGDSYDEFRQNVHYKSVSTARLMVVGEPKNLRFRTVKALAVRDETAVDPTIEIDGRSLTFRGKIKNGHYLEYDPETGRASVWDSFGNLMSEPEVSGEVPLLSNGTSKIRFSGKNESGAPSRVRITIRTQGEKISGR